MVVNWEQELELLRYLGHEAYCIKVLMVVTLNVILILRFLCYLLGRNKSDPCFCLLTFFDKQISSVC